MTPRKLPSIVLAGAGGHAKVLADLIAAEGRFSVLGAVDANPRGEAAKLSGLTILGDDRALLSLLKKGSRHAAVGLGASPDTHGRARLRAALAGLGFELPVLAHPSAILAPTAAFGAGAQVMAGAIVNADASVGAGAVVNTGAIVEHDCDLGDDSFVGPGAVLGGAVSVGARAFVGLGARVNPGVRIGEDAVVGAGAVVVKDVPAGAVVVGVPARERKNG